MNGRERMLAACRSQPVDRPPVWIMRQAGRYLPEYHDVRRGRTFWDILKSPELALEVAQQPLRRFDLDAAILFSDILVVLDAMGCEVDYEAGGPKLKNPYTGPSDLRRLTLSDVMANLGYVAEAMGRLCETVHPDLAVIGFAGAPLTLGAYFVNGGPKNHLRGLKALYYRDPEVAMELLDRLSEAAAELLLMQAKAGADIVQIFDSWAGYLNPEDYAELAVPPLRRMVDRVKSSGVPIILYIRGAASHLEAAALTGCDVLSIDSSISLGGARRRLDRPWALQGNLDPAELLGPPRRVAQRVRELIDEAGARGLIVNVGQGLTPDIPVEGVEAFVKAVHEV